MYKALFSTSLALICLTLRGQTNAPAQLPQDFFHRGAQFYIWDQKQKATNEIYSGLKLFPTDPELNGLAALLQKQDQQKQQQQKQQNQNDQSKQDQKDQQQQQKQDQQQQSEQQNNSQQDEQKKQDQQQQQTAQQQQEQQKNQGSQSKEQQNNRPGETNQEQYAAGQMTPEQARQLLDSEKADEKLLNMKPDGERRKRLRDW